MLPRLFGKYTLLDVCGQGGMGVVYRAWDAAGDRVVALKVLREIEAGRVDDVVRRFEEEARRASALKHPNIARVLDVGEHDGHPYFTMDFVDGYTLAERAGELAQRPRDVAVLVKKIAEAVHHAHQRLILHRDLKPANVMLDADHADEPRLVDFGIARRLDPPGAAADGAVTRTGDLVGTIAYMAPEQLDTQRELTSAVDVHGLGGILYELLTGRAPYEGTSLRERMLEQKEPAAPRSLSAELAERIDADLDNICMKCLRADPRQRYASAASVAHDLQRYLDDEPVVARPLRRRERAARFVRRHPTWVALVVTGVALLGTVAAVAVSVARDQERELRAAAAKNNAFAAHAMSGRVLFELSGLADAAVRIAGDPAVERIIAAAAIADDGERKRTIEAIVEQWADRAARAPFDSVLVLDAKGTWLARSPEGERQLWGSNMAWRDYFAGAQRLGAARIKSTYVSRGYQSKSDKSARFSINVPLFDDSGAFAGVVHAALNSTRALGGIVSRDVDLDADQRVALVARSDRAERGQALPRQWYLLLHDGIAPGAVRFVDDQDELAALPVAREDIVEQLVTPQSSSVVRTERLRDLLDPVHGPVWLAGIAPVGSTHLAVIVQSPVSAAVASNERLAWRLGIASAGAVVVGAAVAAVLIVWNRRRRARI